MEEVDARAILGVSIEASVPDIEAAYRERVGELRKRFEKAIDRRTRTQLEREFAALEDAHDSLLSKPDDQILVDDHSAPAGPHQAEPILTSNELRPGKVFAGRFELERELSFDSAGTVWLAKDYSLQHQVALRFLPDVLTGDRGALEDLKKEVRTRIGLRHPNLARIYAVVEDEGRVAIPTEHVDGQSLPQLRLSKQNQVFEAKDLGTWVKELCSALEHLHKEARLTHGAIEPNCLIVNPKGSLQLADLGLGRLIRDSLIRLIGGSKTNETLAHGSPQQARGEKLTTADDVYSLGASLYDLLTGKPPFYQGNIRDQIEGQSAPLMTERRTQLGVIGELIPKNWEETVAACLAKQAGQRPKSLTEVIQRLEKVDAQPSISPIGQLLSVSPVAKPGSSEVEPVSTPGRREPIPVHHVAVPNKPQSTPAQPSSTPGKPESIPVQRGSVPSKPQSTPVQPVSAAVKAPPDTVVPDSVPAKSPSTPVPPISPPAKPPHAPVERVPPSVGRVLSPVHAPPSPPGTPKTPIGSVPTPARRSQEPGVPAPPAPAKRSRAPLISVLTRRPVRVVAGIILLLLASLALFFWSRSGSPPSANPIAHPSASGSIAQSTASALIKASPSMTVSPQVTASPLVTASPVGTPSSEASATPSVKETPTPNDATPSPTPLTQPEIDSTKQEVIKRINAAPGYTAQEKANLIEKMQRARKMERLGVVRFDTGQTLLTRSASDRLVKAFDQLEMQGKLSDETIVVVVAGYADTGGRPDINLGISQQRAESVAKILKRRLKLTNPIQTIGMGGTELLSNERPDQNRAVEIWAVTVF